MLEKKYALDMDYNFYALNKGFEKYKLSEEEVKEILENKSKEEIEDNGRIMLYDYKFLYLLPEDFIESFKLNTEEKSNLLNDILNIKIKDINKFNLKEISFLFHYTEYLKPVDEEMDVVAYQIPISTFTSSMPFNERWNYTAEEALFRQKDTTRTQETFKNHISLNIEDKISLSGEDSNISNHREDKTLRGFAQGLSDWGLENAGQSQTGNKSTEGQEVAIFCNIFGPEKEEGVSQGNTSSGRVSEEQKYPKIDIDGDGIIDIETKKIAEAALGLEGKASCEDAALDPRKGYVCIDVPYVAYQSQIDMLEKMKRDASLNPTGYTICSENGRAQDDDWIPRRVQNWMNFFYHKGCLFEEGKEGYQVGDVVFIKREGQPDPDHSAIVTKVDSKGKPVEFVVASYGYGKVMKFSLEQWNEYLKDIKGTVIAHGGFRNSETP